MSRLRWARRWLALYGPGALLLACGGGSTGPSIGNLALTVSGLPAGTAASIVVSGPGGYSHSVTATETLTGLEEGNYSIASQPVESGATFYSPLPVSQVSAITSNQTASASVSYSSAATGLNLRVSGLYLTQSVQTLNRDVPLVQDRDGYLRVFVTANQAGAPAPVVRVRLYHNGQVSLDQLINPPTLLTPQSINEGSLSSSWNLSIPRNLIQTNLSILVEVDPDNAIIEGNESDNVFPASGSPQLLDVQIAAPFHVTLIPVQLKTNPPGNVTAANQNQFLDATMRMHPLPGYDIVLGSALQVDTVVDPDNQNSAWTWILAQVNARRVAEHTGRYYYGVVNAPYTQGVAGIGYVGNPPSAVGWDKLPSAASVAAHEWGHNWSRQHAPCGGASAPDSAYPYTGGVIGVSGFDVQGNVLKPSSSHDIMGYCNNEWVSDYTYRAVLEYRGGAPDIVSASSAMIQPALLVWGRMVSGRMELYPAFQVATRPLLPSRRGPYTIQGRAADGSAIFDLSFAPAEVADDPHGEKQFAFAVPLSPERASRLAGIRLLGQGRQVNLTMQSAKEAAVLRATRAGSGRVALEWDGAKAPMLLLRDAASGQIVSFARGGRTLVANDKPELSVTFPNRMQSGAVRIRMPGR